MSLPPGYEVDVKAVAYHRAGLRLKAYTELEIAVPMTLGTYLPYVLSETRDCKSPRTPETGAARDQAS